MLTKHERLRYSGLFTQARQKGKTTQQDFLKITYTPTRADCSDRLPLVGFVVSKKFSKKAVIRNLIKRRMGEIYRIYRQDLDNAKRLKAVGLLVISIKGEYRAAEDYSYTSLNLQLQTLLNALV